MDCVKDKTKSKSGAGSRVTGRRRRKIKKGPRGPRRLPREFILAAAKEADKLTPDGLTLIRFQQLSGIGSQSVYTSFPEGGWTEVRRLARLKTPHTVKRVWSDEELLRDFHRVACKVGRPPTWPQYEAYGRSTGTTFRRHMGSMARVLARDRDWLKENHPDTPWLARLPTQCDVEGSPGPRPEALRAALHFVDPLNFRCLRNAPTNEMGVVFLFGMLAAELGYLIESFHNRYPDCLALRRLEKRRDRWKRVRIEFEFQSRNFRRHAHDPKQCDLIVCWQHDWPKCPLKVLELRAVVGGMAGQPAGKQAA